MTAGTFGMCKNRFVCQSVLIKKNMAQGCAGWTPKWFSAVEQIKMYSCKFYKVPVPLIMNSKFIFSFTLGML